MATNFTLNPSDLLREEQAPKKIPEIFRPYKQSNITDEIRSKLLAPKQLDMINNASTLAKSKLDMVLTIEHYNELESYLGGQNKIESAEVSGKLISAGKLFDCMIITFSKYFFAHGGEIPRGNLALSLPLTEYAELVGKTDIKELRANTKRDLEILRNVKFTSPGLKNKHGKRGSDYHDIYLLTEKGISNGKINFTINERFVEILQEQKTHLAFDIRALRLNARKNPNSYLLYTKLQSHRKINLGKETENKITVKALYTYCTSIPRHEKVLNEDRHVEQRIIYPFERDMDNLSALGLIEWDYIGQEPTSYKEWIESSIHFKIKEEYPLKEEILESKKKFEKKAISEKKKD